MLPLLYPQNLQPSLLHLPELLKHPKEFQQLHSQFIKTNTARNTHYSSKLLAFYALSPHADLEQAATIFNHIDSPDSFAWNTMLRGYSRSHDPEEALLFFCHMTHHFPLPDRFTFPLVFKACARLRALGEGRQVHAWVVKLGMVGDAFVSNTLIHFYGNCGSLVDAHKVFDNSGVLDLVSWNSLLRGYIESGDVKSARSVFDRMPKRDLFSWNTMINGYAKMGNMELAHVLFLNMPERDAVSWNCLMDGYVRIGEFGLALYLFSQMDRKNIVSWTTAILALIGGGHFKEALQLFREMRLQEVQVNRVTVLTVVPAIAQQGALGLGEWLFTYVEKNGISFDESICSAFIDMYSRCGSIESALQVFDRTQRKGIYSWNSMILGLAINGRSICALEFFSRMLIAKVTPNCVTFMGILKACSHGGLVEEGLKYFELMSSDYGIVPDIKHYGCMVDILGRAGFLSEAMELIQRMPMKSNSISWSALLAACKSHDDVSKGEQAAGHLMELDPLNSSAYVLLSNLYASNSQWDEKRKVRHLMDDNGIRKTAGCSSIELDGLTHEFISGDTSHPQAREIYSLLYGFTEHSSFSSIGCF